MKPTKHIIRSRRGRELLTLTPDQLYGTAQTPLVYANLTCARLRSADLRKAQRKAQQADTDRERERVFVTVARETLPPTTYQTLWAEVNRRLIEGTTKETDQC